VKQVSVLTRRFARNSVYHFTTQVISKGLFFLTTVYLARRLGAVQYGQFAFAYGLVSLFSLLTKFGLDLLTSSEVGENTDRAPEFFTGSLLLRISLSGIVLLILWLLVPFLQKTPEVNSLIFVLALAVMAQSLGGASTSLFEAFQFFGYRSFLNLCMFGLLLACVVIANRFNPTLSKSGYAYLIAASVYCAIALALCRAKIARFSWPPSFAFLKRLFLMALPLGLSEIFIGIYYRADTVLLSLFDTDAVVGWYDAAYTFVYGLRLLPVSIAMVMLPGLSRIFAESPEEALQYYRTAIRYSSAVGFFLTFVLAAASKLWVHIVFGDQYGPSAQVLPILIWTCAIMFVNSFQGIFLIVSRQRKRFFYTTGVGAVSNLIFNLILIPRYSMYGAAWATVLSEFLVFVVSAQSLSGLFSWKELLSSIGVPAITIALLQLGWILLSVQPNPVSLVVSLIAYFLPVGFALYRWSVTISSGK
jgi:O-antigen/teichoic acid export membrane protein